MVAGARVGFHFLASALRLLEPRLDDDFVDRLHYLYTSIILLMFALLVSAKQYENNMIPFIFGHPIECFVPAQFTPPMEQYSENYCWIQNTYWIPFQDHIPHRLDDRERKQIGYYQWVPFMFAIAAMTFYMPATVWRMLANQSGLNVSLILQNAVQDENLDPIVRDKTIDILSRHMDDALRYQRELGSKNKNVFLFALFKFGRFYGSYVTVVYIFVKLLHIFNVIIHFYWLNKFLETADYPLFGGHVLYDLWNEREWRDSGKFPRVTLCDFEIRVLGNIHRHTVQCVLVINMFTEKIFVFLWLWMLFLTALSIISLSIWLATIGLPSCRQAFVEKYLELSVEPGGDLAPFVEKFLRPDGVFILKMVSTHAGNMMCCKVVESLWIRYLEWQNLVLRKELRRTPSAKERRRSESKERERILRNRTGSPPREDNTVNPHEVLSNRVPIASITDTRHYV